MSEGRLPSYPRSNPFRDDGDHVAWEAHERANYRALFGREPRRMCDLLGYQGDAGIIAGLFWAIIDGDAPQAQACHWYMTEQWRVSAFVMAHIDALAHTAERKTQRLTELRSATHYDWDAIRQIKTERRALIDAAFDHLQAFFRDRAAPEPAVEQLSLIAVDDD